MANEITINLDPVTQSGLTIAAKLFLGSTLATTIALTESPAGSARYRNAASISGLAAGNYDGQFVRTDNGSQVGTFGGYPFRWSGIAELPVPATDGAGNALATDAHVLATLTAIGAIPAGGLTTDQASKLAALFAVKPDYKPTIGNDGKTLVASTVPGDGKILVNHDYGGIGHLSAEVAGVPQQDVVIRAYNAAAFAADASTAVVLAAAITDNAGDWIGPMYLDSGLVTLVYSFGGDAFTVQTNITVE